MSETEILRSCKEWLEWKTKGTKAIFWRQNAGLIPGKDGSYRRFVGRKGLPDIFLILPPDGKLCAIETKSPGRGLSPDQKVFHDELIAAGGISCIVSSVQELEIDLAPYL